MTIRILVAGGCHVVGYPIGETFSFVRVAQRILAMKDVWMRPRCMSRVPIKRARQLLEAVESYQPDVLVLQLGNYETTVTYRQYFRRLLGLKKKSDSSSCALAPETKFTPGPAWWRKCQLKLWMDQKILGGKMLDVPATGVAFASMLDSLAVMQVPRVIVLSPLPCADPLYMTYRYRLARHFELEAAARNFQYVNLLQARNVSNHFFSDATHLNRAGHEWVGREVAEAIYSAVKTAVEAGLTADVTAGVTAEAACHERVSSQANRGDPAMTEILQ